MTTENDVREASKTFYAALNSMAKGNVATMASIWSQTAAVSAMHPIGGRELGRDHVQKSWEEVSKLLSGCHVELIDQIIQVSGDMAYELGVERGQLTLAGQQVTLSHRVTNVYRRESGGWRIVHHHTDISPAMLDVLSQFKSKS